jgi:diaminopimelate decarboxylase
VSGFFRENGQLTCDGVPLSRIARDAGTPVYVYSRAAIEESFRRFDRAFSPVPHLVCYAAKANSSLAILKILAALNAGADVVSRGELRAALSCGFPPEKIVFSGVGKTDEEIADGVAAGILAFNAESERELDKIEIEAARRERRVRVALRVNPDIDAKSHPYISTGRAHNKFGVDISRAMELYRRARSFPHISMTGVQAHIGSQILEAAPLAETARELAALARLLTEEGFALETLDIGGGIGIASGGETLIEPGRAIVGPAGALVTRVLDVKENRQRRFVVTDAGMNDMIRPALYGAIHPIESADTPRGQTVTADVVGPICESSDFFARDLALPLPAEGELLVIRDAGAYGFAMSSNYNFRPRAAEVLVEGGSFRVIRRRETFEDLVRLEGG